MLPLLPSSTQYKVNSLGPIHAITAFLPLLRASDTKNIIVIGSGAADPKTALAGSVPNFLAYSMTKAAALVATTKFAVKLRDEGFVVVTFCPGRVDCSATLSAECRKALVEIRKVSSSMEDHFGAEMALQSPEASVGRS
uniref:Lysine--tRNA ligase ) n=1 Tax=Ganoderma boninense TaxID=34458 RepID=A0A5K1K280_9APHY|nr:Lysine--tRNA ligase (EC (Lysyl-tRNA synthetase) [Ganoderma boninense]